MWLNALLPLRNIFNTSNQTMLIMPGARQMSRSFQCNLSNWKRPRQKGDRENCPEKGHCATVDVAQDEVDGTPANEHQEPGLAQDFKGNGKNTAFWGRGDFVVARFSYLCRRFFFRKARVITKIGYIHYR